jgi:hypothetical protein
VQILIDNKLIDFTLEQEKNSFEIITALAKYLNNNSMLISSAEVNGKEYYTGDRASLEKITLDVIDRISITTVTFKEFKYSQLLLIQDYFQTLIQLIKEKDFIKITKYLEEYSTVKLHLESVIDRAFSSGGGGFIESIAENNKLSEKDLIDLKNFSENIIFMAVNRQKEIISTMEELGKEKAWFENFLPELGNISVLMQTGKDKAAMEKIIEFIDFSKKLSRLMGYYNAETGKIDLNSLSNYNKLLNELVDALSRSDSVLTGDLLEYEIAPAIEQFFDIMKDDIVTYI